jgi:hypothetical protein
MKLLPGVVPAGALWWDGEARQTTAVQALGVIIAVVRERKSRKDESHAEN